ncbi:MAG: cysteine desulfurase family protein [Phycisphaerales bacterium JB043]
MSVYLDNNATTQPASQVVDAMTECLTTRWHNPSSVHRPGQEARRLVELARRDVGELLGTRARNITFTSGGTEGLQTAIRGVLSRVPSDSPATIATTRIEHSAVGDLLNDIGRDRPSLRVEYLPLDDNGIIDVRGLSRVTQETLLVCAHWANNETGAIQPVEAIVARCRELDVASVIDATQMVGKVPIDFDASGIDLLVCSAHKLHGPKGVGALATRTGVQLRPSQPGTQELGRRGGTENVAGIVGFGAAARQSLAWFATPELRSQQEELRDRLEATLLREIPNARLNTPGDGAPRLWNTINIGFAGVQSEALLMLLSEQGVCASAGAACSSGSLEPSPVLLALGVPESHALGSIRLSLSRHTTPEEIARAEEIIPRCVRRIRDSTTTALPTT